MLINSQIANFSFLFLLGSMICYWLGPLSRDLFGTMQPQPRPVAKQAYSPNISSYTTNKDSMFEQQSKAELLSLEETKFPRQDFNQFTSSTENWFVKKNFDVSKILQLMGRYGIIISNILLIALLCNRWKESGHFPLSNLYESLMFLSWSFTLIHLLIENWTKTDTVGGMNVAKYIGAITTPSALLTNAFATFTLPKEMQSSSSLVPALQSNWLMMHVTVMILSYAALILGSLLSIAFLIITLQTNNNANLNIQIQNNESTSRKTKIENKRNYIASTLDNLSYRILGIGFPFLTIGILSGAVWANEAWGSYWSWDPKETWALLTWLVYAIYLHTRLNKGWVGKKPAIISSLGFVVVWICYLGVNLIGEGLHSYGWIIN